MIGFGEAPDENKMKKQGRKSIIEVAAGGWQLYIIRCSDDTLYTGITNDTEARIQAHNLGKGAKYTHGRGPVQLLAVWNYPNRSEASKAEYACKKMSRSQKLLLILSGLEPLNVLNPSRKKQ